MYLFYSIYAWMRFLFVPVKWFCWRAGLLKRRPMFIDHYHESQTAWGQLTCWNPRLRIVGAENCPQSAPAVFAGNHIKLDDPFFAWRSAYVASRQAIKLFFMMRDDYFHGFPWDLSPIPVIEIAEMGGGVKITRDNVSLAQLKPFLEILQRPGSFIIFPGRTRTRSGMVMEFREGIEEPGGVSFFLVHGQRRAGSAIPCVPIARTHNHMTWKSAVVIGAPRYLAVNASREEQREFDCALAAAIGDLVECNIFHLLSGPIYLHALHARGNTVPVAALVQAVQYQVAAWPVGRYLDPMLRSAGLAQLDREVRRAMRYVAKSGLLTLEGEAVRLEVKNILAAPELDTSYLKKNPVKYHVNQAMHLAEVVALFESIRLDA